MEAAPLARLQLRAGQSVYEQGEPASSFYIVSHGELQAVFTTLTLTLILTLTLTLTLTLIWSDLSWYPGTQCRLLHCSTTLYNT